MKWSSTTGCVPEFRSAGLHGFVRVYAGLHCVNHLGSYEKNAYSNVGAPNLWSSRQDTALASQTSTTCCWQMLKPKCRTWALANLFTWLAVWVLAIVQSSPQGESEYTMPRCVFQNTQLWVDFWYGLYTTLSIPHKHIMSRVFNVGNKTLHSSKVSKADVPKWSSTFQRVGLSKEQHTTGYSSRRKSQNAGDSTGAKTTTLVVALQKGFGLFFGISVCNLVICVFLLLAAVL